MTTQDKYLHWCKHVNKPDLVQLQSMQVRDIQQAFDGDIKFGTAGLRGIMGIGSNRVNVYTIRRVTQGVALYLRQHYPEQHLCVAVSYDNRYNSQLLARCTASVLANNDIHCLVFDKPTSTPILAYATVQLRCTVGIMITASHNSNIYNGYKIFDSQGVQLIDTTEISRLIQSIDVFDPNISTQLIDVTYIDKSIYDNYLQVIDAHWDNNIDASNVNIVYTPLNGTGCNTMSQLLSRYNCKLYTVPQQDYCDGEFATCPNPNPEHMQSFDLALKIARANNADIVIATDPDGDRVGAMVLHNAEYRHINGNEMGILLTEYLLSTNQSRVTPIIDPVIVRTMVSTNLVDKIADKYKATVLTTLTGFKYIGNIARQLKDRLLLGFEESMGYLSGNHIGDKDAYVATLLIIQIASICKSRNITLVDKLHEIFGQYGYFGSKTLLVKFEDVNKINAFMSNLRSTHFEHFGQFDVQLVCDYITHHDDLMRSNMIVYKLANEIELIFRPSGTEPLLKVYILACMSCQDSKIAIDHLTSTIVDMTK